MDNLVEINMFYDNIFFYGACMMYFCIVKEGFTPTSTAHRDVIQNGGYVDKGWHMQ